MGMTILQAQQRLHEKWMELTKDGKDEEMMQALSIADTVLGNYDESLKADMMAMLEELHTEIAKVPKYRMTHNGICVYRRAEDYIFDINKVIQEKINKLKENKDDN